MCQAASCPLEIRVCGIQLVLRLLLATKFDQVLLLWVILRVWKAALPVRRIVLRRKMQRAVPARRIDDLQHARRNQKPTYRCLEHVFRCAFRWSSGMLDISKYAEHSLHVKACKDFLASLPRTTSANLKLEFAGVKVAAAPSALDLLLEKLGSAVASPSSSSRLWEPARCSDLRGEILRSTCWGLSRTQSCDIPSWDSGAAFGDWGSKGTTGAASVATGLSVLPAVDISATPTSDGHSINSDSGRLSWTSRPFAKHLVSGRNTWEYLRASPRVSYSVVRGARSFPTPPCAWSPKWHSLLAAAGEGRRLRRRGC
eukprot:m.89154 g.89154  ORF g.89154 m.89154 type:complete len:313 (-) comp51027_c0_seq42:55-993(-)